MRFLLNLVLSVFMIAVLLDYLKGMKNDKEKSDAGKNQ